MDQNEATYTVPVARAITYARDVANDMDFLGISDHNHNESLNMTMARWLAGNHEADSVNQDGVFVGMRGQEWGTINGGGHILIYGTQKLFGWNPGVYEVYVPKSNYTLLFDSVKKYNGFGYLAHPSSDDYSNLINIPYNATWDSVIEGVSMKNGPALTAGYTESNPSSTTYESYFHSLLKLGYHVAPVANQDNHHTNFGMLNQQRTAVLAPSLTRANIVDALRNRRAYATEDHNLQVRFEVGSHQMGEIFTQSGSVGFRVKATDVDASNLISSIQIRYGVPGSGSNPTTLTSVSNVDSLIYTHAQPIGSTYYYYVLVTETNGRRAWTAPMWITISTGPPPVAFNQLSPMNTAANQPVSGTLSWQTAGGATQYDIYLGTTNPPTTLVSSNQTDTTYTYSGLSNNQQYYWKVVAENGNGSTNATGSPWAFTTIPLPPASFAHVYPPNASNDISVNGPLRWRTSINATGYDVYLGTDNPPTTLVSSNQADTFYNYTGLQNSTPYFWKVVARNAAGTLDATSSPFNFSTIIAPPGAFTLVAPVSAAVEQPLSGTLTWHNAPNTMAYDVYLDSVDPPALLLFTTNSPDTSLAYSGLESRTTYYWKVVAQNPGGSTMASNAVDSFFTVDVPPQASNPASSPIATTTLQISWEDNATNESGYRIYRSASSGGPFSQIGGDLPPNATSFSDSGLGLNERYYYRIIPFNGIGEGDFVATNAATLAIPPGATSISDVTYSSLRVTFDADVNPSQTQFAIRLQTDSTVQYAQANGSVGTTPAWRTSSEWGGPGGVVVTGLVTCNAYAVDAKARNLDAVETIYGSESNDTILCYLAQRTMAAGWNLVSVPIDAVDSRRVTLFPSSGSTAFAYQGGYLSAETLRVGRGYWIRFSSPDPVSLIGQPKLVDSISINAGWNMIGSIALPVSVGAITQEPSGIISTSFYSYEGAYSVADSLLPMQAYWVKANAPGQILLAASSAASRNAPVQTEVLENLSKIVFSDRAGHSQCLYFISSGDNLHLNDGELPPKPPLGAFDARFDGDRYVETLPDKKPRHYTLAVQSNGGEVELAWDFNSTPGYKFSLSVDNKIMALGGSGSRLLKRDESSLVLHAIKTAENTIPVEFALHQNYPNPFNPATEIRYDLPFPSDVRLTVYNLLGVEVAILIQERQEAGSHITSWNPSGASGLYFYRIEARNADDGNILFQRTRSMMFLK